MAAGSLAQVHRAKTRRGGHLVAVKIQYPELKEDAKLDVDTIELLVEVRRCSDSKCIEFSSTVKMEILRFCSVLIFLFRIYFLKKGCRHAFPSIHLSLVN